MSRSHCMRPCSEDAFPSDAVLLAGMVSVVRVEPLHAALDLTLKVLHQILQLGLSFRWVGHALGGGGVCGLAASSISTFIF